MAEARILDFSRVRNGPEPVSKRKVEKVIEKERIGGSGERRVITEGDVVRTSDPFWGSRPILRQVAHVADHNLMSRWGLLGGVICKALCTIAPFIVLPNSANNQLKGGQASLNMFVILMGEAGVGKGTMVSVVDQVITGLENVRAEKEGSGEGIPTHFKRKVKNEETGYWEWRLVDPPAVLITVSEGGSLVKVLGRSGSTLPETLQSGWSGEALGFSNKDKTESVIIEGHTYRLCLMVCMQPLKAGGLFDYGDGGLPQRFLMLPVDRLLNDDGLVINDEGEIIDLSIGEGEELRGPLEWVNPFEGLVVGENGLDENLGMIDTGRGLLGVVVCEKARMEIRNRRILQSRKNKPLGVALDPMDAHLMQIRLKVAVFFAIIEGRLAVTEEDWWISGEVIKEHIKCRDDVREVLEKNRRVGALRAGQEMGWKRKAEVETVRDEEAAEFRQAMMTELRALVRMACDEERKRPGCEEEGKAEVLESAVIRALGGKDGGRRKSLYGRRGIDEWVKRGVMRRNGNKVYVVKGKGALARWGEDGS